MRTLLISAVLLSACADCECRIDNGSPNFSVKVNYVTAPRPGNFLVEDTLMAHYFLTVQEEGVQKKYIGQMDYTQRSMHGLRTLQWLTESDGERASHETSAELNKCLWMGVCRQSELQQEIGDIRSIMEAQQNEQKR